jgi:hypothetical protein
VPCCLILLAVLAGCSATGAAPARSSGGPTVIRVPQQEPTISAAVAAAQPGDMVLVSPGVYRESVTVGVANLTLRGTDRNAVVIDGEVRRANGIVVTAPGVSVENLTVRRQTLNGVLVTGMSDGQGGIAKGSDGYTRLDPAAFPPLQGFRVAYVTASDNGLYGIYAFDTQHGVIEQNYASGSADSGIYVGQCQQCDIQVLDNVAERNAVGYEGTNASGQMYVLRNRFVANRVGMTTDSDYQEAFVPQRGATLVGNLVSDNNDPTSPAQADGGFGIGIGISGGTDNLVARNRVERNTTAGLVLGSAEDLAPLGNNLVGNSASGNGVDVAIVATPRAPAAGNCMRDNQFTTSLPAGLIAAMDCGAGAPGTQPAAAMPPMPTVRGVPFPDVPLPPAQPSMPDATNAPARPATGKPPPIDPDSVGLPAPTLLADRSVLR